MIWWIISANTLWRDSRRRASISAGISWQWRQISGSPAYMNIILKLCLRASRVYCRRWSVCILYITIHWAAENGHLCMPMWYAIKRQIRQHIRIIVRRWKHSRRKHWWREESVKIMLPSIRNASKTLQRRLLEKRWRKLCFLIGCTVMIRRFAMSSCVMENWKKNKAIRAQTVLPIFSCIHRMRESFLRMRNGGVMRQR